MPIFVLEARPGPDGTIPHGVVTRLVVHAPDNWSWANTQAWIKQNRVVNWPKYKCSVSNAVDQPVLVSREINDPNKGKNLVQKFGENDQILEQLRDDPIHREDYEPPTHQWEGDVGYMDEEDRQGHQPAQDQKWENDKWEGDINA